MQPSLYSNATTQAVDTGDTGVPDSVSDESQTGRGEGEMGENGAGG